MCTDAPAPVKAALQAKAVAAQGAKVLNQVASSSCERSWSAYDFIHSKLRNKLASSRAEDLVYVYSNSCSWRSGSRLGTMCNR